MFKIVIWCCVISSFVFSTGLQNCEMLSDMFAVSWTVNTGPQTVSIVLQAEVDSGDYISFGVSGPTLDGSAQMIGSDVAFATESAGVVDYFLTSQLVCRDMQDPDTTEGVCTDESLGGVNDVFDESVDYSDGIMTAHYSRPLNPNSATDLEILPEDFQLFIWSRGQIQGHLGNVVSRGEIVINMGRTASNNCGECALPLCEAAPANFDKCETGFDDQVISYTACQDLNGGEGRVSLGRLLWSVRGSDIDILYEVEANSWIGIGWSHLDDRYAMTGSYAIVGWATDGNEHIGDYDLTSISGIFPWPSDKTQISNALVENDGTFTRIKFTRPLTVSVPGPDGNLPVEITEDGLVHLVYAHGKDDNFPSSGDASPIGISDAHAGNGRDKWFNFSFSEPLMPNIGGNSEEEEDSDGQSECDPFDFGGETLTLPGCSDLTTMYLYWSLDVDNDMLDLYAINKDEDEWIGFGFNIEPAAMVGSDTVIGWIDDNGDLLVDDFHLGGIAVADVNVAGNQETTFMEASLIDGVVGIHFVRPLKVKVGAEIPEDGDVNIVYAVGPFGGDFIEYHDVPKRASGAFNFQSGVQTDTVDAAKAVHGVFMGLGWGLFIPLAVLMARFGKSYGSIWFQIHRGLNSFGLLISLIAFILALVDFGTRSFPLHLGIGCIVMILGVLQPINAIFRPHKPNDLSAIWPTPQRMKWNYLHWWTGRIAMFLAFVNIILGLQMYPVEGELQAIFFVGYVFIVGVFVVFEVKKCFAARATNDVEMGAGPRT